jgi:hypothetical protein
VTSDASEGVLSARDSRVSRDLDGGLLSPLLAASARADTWDLGCDGPARHGPFKIRAFRALLPTKIRHGRTHRAGPSSQPRRDDDPAPRPCSVVRSRALAVCRRHGVLICINADHKDDGCSRVDCDAVMILPAIRC